MACDVEVQDAPAIMANNEEAVEKTEGDRRNGEEIHGGDGFAMIAEKSQPPPARFWISGRSLHPAGDASLRYIKAEHHGSMPTNHGFRSHDDERLISRPDRILAMHNLIGNLS
jgi:hypothetical protein